MSKVLLVCHHSFSQGKRRQIIIIPIELSCLHLIISHLICLLQNLITLKIRFYALTSSLSARLLVMKDVNAIMLVAGLERIKEKRSWNRTTPMESGKRRFRTGGGKTWYVRKKRAQDRVITTNMITRWYRRDDSAMIYGPTLKSEAVSFLLHKEIKSRVPICSILDAGIPRAGDGGGRVSYRILLDMLSLSPCDVLLYLDSRVTRNGWKIGELVWYARKKSTCLFVKKNKKK